MAQIPQEYSETSFQVEANKANIVKVLAENQSNNKLAIEFKVININYGFMTKKGLSLKKKRTTVWAYIFPFPLLFLPLSFIDHLLIIDIRK